VNLHAPATEWADDRPIRVTHVVFDFNGGGLETLVAEMAARYRNTSVRMSLVTLGGRVGRLGEATRDRFDQFHVVGKMPRGISMVWPTALVRAIRDTCADVVHVHSGSWFKGVRGARIAGVPRVVYTEHGREHDDPFLSRVIDRLASRETDVVAAVSGRLANYLETTVGIARDKVVVAHNGVDTSAFTPGVSSPKLRESLRIPPGAFVIGSVGRLETVKAYDRLLDAAATLRHTLDREVIVVLCGEGSQRELLRAHAARLGISELVRLAGWSQNVVDFHRLFDVFVLSSTSEGQSVSLIEAMACGVPPVVTDVGANAETLGPDLQQQVVPVGDASRLAAALARTLSAHDSSSAMRIMLRQRAVQEFSLDRMIEQYARLYRG
jgi:glycosyltransferase involved in cell wall biosynthesis